MYQEKKVFLWIILLIANLQDVISQNNKIPIGPIHAPYGLSLGKFINSVTQNDAYMGWIPMENAHSYTIRLYTLEDDIPVLQREITNIKFYIIHISDLEPETEYNVTVSAVFENSNGVTVETQESKPIRFKTREVCKGGQIWTECDGKCLAKCDDPDPVCSRVCQPGCNCPTNANVWNGDTCIVAELCPTKKGTPVQVENLHVLDSGETVVILAWDIHEGAYIYDVTVKVAENESVVQTLETEIPIISIPNLTPGVIYSFGVLAYVRRIESVRPRSALTPPKFFVSAISNTSFTVNWKPNPHSVRYAFTLYDDSGINVLYENDKIGGNSIQMAQLTPGTIYLFSLATAGPNEDVGISSPKTRIRTLGKKAATENNREAVITLKTEAVNTTKRPTAAITNITNCLLQYQSVQGFYEKFNQTGGTESLRYPNCDLNGLYVTKLCEVDDATSCWCIDAEEGKKRKGSDFGGLNSHFPLNCDKYGSLKTVKELNFRVTDVKSSSMTVEWDSVPEAHSYIVYIYNKAQPSEERTMALNAALNEYKITDLEPGSLYEIGMYVVNVVGASSPLSILNSVTALVDKPIGVQVVSHLPDNSQVTWKVQSADEAYSVRLLEKKSGTVVTELSEIQRNSVTFKNLTVFETYIVEIRAIGYQYDENTDEPTYHFSIPATIEILVQCSLPPVDLVFAFEASSPTSWEGHLQAKKLAVNLVKELPDINTSDGTRVGAFRFNQRAIYIFGFDRFKNNRNLEGALNYIRYLGGSSPQVGEALKKISTTFFINPKTSNRKRKNSLSVAIVFTTGRTSGSLTSKPFSNYVFEARRLKRYTKVMTISPQGKANNKVLENIASDGLNVILPSYEAYESSTDVVLRKLCSITS